GSRNRPYEEEWHWYRRCGYSSAAGRHQYPPGSYAGSHRHPLMGERLSLAQWQPLRAALATSLQSLSTPQLCWQLGQQCESPGTAFFVGYQAAMRCLDPALPATMVAAFCISERGVRNPWQMHSRL